MQIRMEFQIIWIYAEILQKAFKLMTVDVLKTVIMMAVVLGLTGCASLRGGPPSCDGNGRRPVGSVVGSIPDRTSLAPDASVDGGRHG